MIIIRGCAAAAADDDERDSKWCLCSIGSCQILYCKEYDARLIVNSDEQQHKFNLRGENKSGARGQRDVVAVDGIEYSLAVLYQL